MGRYVLPQATDQSPLCLLAVPPKPRARRVWCVDIWLATFSIRIHDTRTQAAELLACCVHYSASAECTASSSSVYISIKEGVLR